mgnify:CR=1 FL=1
MPKLVTEFEEEETGWARWVPPVMTGYKIACCDCGLVHDMEFLAVEIIKRLPNDEFEYVELDPKKYRVVFRARRNNRSTGQVRRHKA